jgi:ABC-type spermidine/putrescine transport system permease subunit II
MRSVGAAREPLVVPHGLRGRLLRPSAAFERLALILGPTLLVFFLAWVWFPVIELGLMSINKQPFSGIPNGRITGAWYDALFREQGVGSSLQMSLIIGLIVGSIVASAAFATARRFGSMQHRGAFLLYVMLPIFIPGLVYGFALLIYSAEMGLEFGPRTIAAAHLAWAFPFGFLAMLITTSRLDPRLLEAAEDLGGSRWQVFRDIEFPLLRPGFVAAFLGGFLLSFNELVRSIFVSGTTTTLPLFIWAQNSSHQSTVPLVYALTTLITLASLTVIAVAYAILFRKAAPARLGRNV